MQELPKHIFGEGSRPELRQSSDGVRQKYRVGWGGQFMAAGEVDDGARPGVRGSRN